MSIPFDEAALLKFLKRKRVELYGKLVELRTAAEGWLAYIPQTFPHYTRHTVLHSDAIVVQMSKLIFEDNDPSRPTLPISPMEAYIAAAAAYLHDAGMVVSDQKKGELIASDSWREWTGNGGSGAHRWAGIQEFRDGNAPPDPALRNFLADVQTRFLIAEFVRRTHHFRVKELLSENEDQLGRFAFNNPTLLRTIANVCIAHGLQQSELEDHERYPDRRDIDGQQTNVQFLALLLRLGDLLDMSVDRACPLLLNAACPLPPESFAHWTQYRRITHSVTAPDLIEITAECENQEEHRFLSDWCQWLVDEIRSASFLVGRSRRHGDWRLPAASMDGPDATIHIRPAATAQYIPSRWKFDFDADAVFTRFIEDIYESPTVFLRELIQNALDATRCQLYLDLAKDGESTPDSPTQVAEQRRGKYPLRISLEQRPVKNELSGVDELRQVVVVEDVGLGMDRDIIHRYFLQVARSFYTTPEFRRRFKFVPTSRFGLGFLSVFAVSDHIVVETYKPTSISADGPVRIVLTGPRNYLLLEKGRRRTNGTRIEVLLREQMQAGEVTRLIRGWCRRVEFPILVSELGMEATVTAESASDFVYEIPDVSEEGAKFVVRAYDIQRQGIEGELYVFAHVDAGGESWAAWHWSQSSYPETSPQASAPPFPESVRCINGIRLEGGLMHYDYLGKPLAARLDFRDGSIAPALSRMQAVQRKTGQERERDARVSSRWAEILTEHLETTERAKSSDAWAYKQALVGYFPFESFWAGLPGTIRFRTRDAFQLMSLREALQLPQFATTSVARRRISPRRETGNSNLTPPDAAHTLVAEDFATLSEEHRSELFRKRSVQSFEFLSPIDTAIRWTSSPPQVLQFGRTWSRPAYLVSFGVPRVVGTEIHKTWSSVYPALLFNSDNPLINWLTLVRRSCATGEYSLTQEQFDRLYLLLDNSTRFPSLAYVGHLNAYLNAWRLMTLPGELRPPDGEVTADLFYFTQEQVRDLMSRHHA